MTENDGGMTMRDYFAVAALQAIITTRGIKVFPPMDRREALQETRLLENVAGAYDYADAMLAERAK